MRAFDRFLHLLMWLCLAAGLTILARFAYGAATGPGISGIPLVSVAMFGFAWLPPALALWAYDGARPGAQSGAFYVLALIAATAVAFVALFVLALVNSFS